MLICRDLCLTEFWMCLLSSLGIPSVVFARKVNEIIFRLICIFSVNILFTRKFTEENLCIYPKMRKNTLCIYSKMGNTDSCTYSKIVSTFTCIYSKAGNPTCIYIFENKKHQFLYIFEIGKSYLFIFSKYLMPTDE